MKNIKKLKKGFTLVELVVVIAVIAILAAVSVGAYFGVTESAKNSKADQEAKAFHTSVMLVVNDPDSNQTFNKETGLDVDNNFHTKIVAMSGLEYKAYDANTTDFTAKPESAVEGTPGYYVTPEDTDKEIIYVSTDLEVRYINIATGKIAESTTLYHN